MTQDSKTQTKVDYTITYLQMDAPPSYARHAAPSNVSHALLHVSNPPAGYFRYLYDAVGAAHEWTDMHDLTAEEVRRYAQHKDIDLFVLMIEGWPAGFFQLDYREFPICDLAYFGLVPEAIGRGFGKYLLAEAILTAWDRDIEKLTVNTCTLDHPAALGLYQKMGFNPVERENTSRLIGRGSSWCY